MVRTRGSVSEHKPAVTSDTKSKRKQRSQSSVEHEPMEPPAVPLVRTMPELPIPRAERPFWVSFTNSSRYAMLRARAVVPSRFLDSNALHTLGIADEFHQRLTRCGWSELRLLCPHTYRGLTYEFLGSFKRHEDSISYTVRGEQFTSTKDEIAECFDWPREGFVMLPRGSETPFWQLITGTTEFWDGHSNNSSSIQDVSLRFLSRLLAFNLLGRGSVGKVSRAELTVLYCFYHGHPCDFTALLFDKLAAESEKAKGNIVCGGLISVIGQAVANCFSANSSLLPVPGPVTLDIPYLLKIGMIKKNHFGGYSVLGRPPAPAPMDVRPQGPVETSDVPTASGSVPFAGSTSMDDRLVRIEESQLRQERSMSEMLRRQDEYFRFVGFTPSLPPTL